LVLFCVLGVVLCTWYCFVFLVLFCVLGVVLFTWCCFAYLVLFCVLGDRSKYCLFYFKEAVRP
jgi:hypothetical protein